MDFTLSAGPVYGPASLGFSNSTTAGTLTQGQSTALFNFLDRWSFSLAQDANVGAFVGSLNFTDSQGQVFQGIDNLQLRLVGVAPSGNILVVGWQSVVQYTGAQTLFSVVSPTVFRPGAYSLEVRGQLVGAASAYAGTLQTAAAVPLPPSFSSLAVGLFTLAGLRVWRRTRGASKNMRPSTRAGMDSK
jgi:hypothetical protein